ncbi:MAG TPA: alpha/beta hydrolase, partial [Phenylobacterium sp.]
MVMRLHWIARLLVIAALLVCVGIVGVIGWRIAAQHRVAVAARIDTPPGIDEGRFLRIDGLDQWVTVRGQDMRNPILLVLDGGPGYATSHLIPGRVENRFTVVKWDQPGAGRTFGRAGRRIPEPLTEDDFAAYGIQVAEHACRRLGHRKVALLATSWGTGVGIRMVRTRPDLFYAYVGSGQVVDAAAGEVLNYRRVLAKATARGDSATLARLQRLGPPPYATQAQLRVLRQAAMAYEDGAPGAAEIFGGLLSAPRYSLADVRNWWDGFQTATDRFYAMRMSRNLPALGLTFQVPVFVFQGQEDDFTPHSLARGYFDALTAPKKRFVSVP